MEALSCELIEKSLQLTGKTFFDMFEIQSCLYNWTPLTEFSIERFCFYLLSPEFIEKYKIRNPIASEKPSWVSYIIGYAIYEYQSWNSQPLIDLLSKI